jgi:hypothetical protein
MAGIFDYQAGEFIREATADEYRRYLREIAHLPQSERFVGAVDGTPYGLPDRVIWMEE